MPSVLGRSKQNIMRARTASIRVQERLLDVLNVYADSHPEYAKKIEMGMKVAAELEEYNTYLFQELMKL